MKRRACAGPGAVNGVAADSEEEEEDEMEELRRAAQAMRAASEAIKRKREISPPIVISDSDALSLLSPPPRSPAESRCRSGGPVDQVVADADGAAADPLPPGHTGVCGRGCVRVWTGVRV